MEKLNLIQWSQLLPHGVECISMNNTRFTFGGINVDVKPLCIDGYFYGESRPILYPIDCLTKEITVKGYNNGDPFVPIKELGRVYNMNVVEYCMIEQNAQNIDFALRTFSFNVIQTLLSWHINVIGIPDGLFVDKSKLEGVEQ